MGLISFFPEDTGAVQGVNLQSKIRGFYPQSAAMYSASEQCWRTLIQWSSWHSRDTNQLYIRHTRANRAYYQRNWLYTSLKSAGALSKRPIPARC